jgi:plastocyanin
MNNNIKGTLIVEKKINLIALSIILIIISAIIVMPGCKSDNSTNSPANSGGSPGVNEVWMQGIAFAPASKTISVGTTITWTNKDNTTHTATSGVPNSPDGLFNSGNLGNGGTFSFKFTTAGTFKYYCAIHGAMMTATMTVQ